MMRLAERGRLYASARLMLRWRRACVLPHRPGLRACV